MCPALRPLRPPGPGEWLPPVIYCVGLCCMQVLEPDPEQHHHHRGFTVRLWAVWPCPSCPSRFAPLPPLPTTRACPLPPKTPQHPTSVLRTPRSCEFLSKLDLTCNFVDVDALEASMLHLRPLLHLKELFLMGNPLQDWPSHRLYIIACLPQLQTYDGVEVGGAVAPRLVLMGVGGGRALCAPQ